ncbi:MAG: hypothetical protein HETSPECPRED_009106 [Heterodermia speciosa]|uniref:Cupin type-2 domain-containing protein n=1 Tax=Heterodermia speciosa TaxID=116794 RepID=A0A8H3IYI1_9LECA|nr:MAG: hypothetical protein HETSPECPRED_009106 [Heterodermia speciosa]
MLSFLTHPPPRTPRAHLHTYSTEDSTSHTTFLPSSSSSSSATSPSSKSLLRSTQRPGPSIHDPPYHWHKHQTEHFTIESGTFLAVLDGHEHTFHPGQVCTIPPGRYHTYRNGSPDKELTFRIDFDPQEKGRDEAFFRNVYAYVEDCRRAGVRPSIFQLCLWLYVFDCYLALPGPGGLARGVSEWLVWVLGVVVGKRLLGMRESYPEYYAGDINRVLGGRDAGKKEL